MEQKVAETLPFSGSEIPKISIYLVPTNHKEDGSKTAKFTNIYMFQAKSYMEAIKITKKQTYMKYYASWKIELLPLYLPSTHFPWEEFICECYFEVFVAYLETTCWFWGFFKDWIRFFFFLSLSFVNDLFLCPFFPIAFGIGLMIPYSDESSSGSSSALNYLIVISDSSFYG